MTGQPPTEKLLAMLRDPLAEAGLDLEDVEMSTAGRRRVVRVLVDKDGGVTLDEIADATRLVSAALDSGDVLGETPYTLEITSPGLDRPLTQPRHWRRNVDRLVKVRPREGSVFTGRVVDADEDAAVLDVAGEKRRVDFADVAKATVQVEFNRRSPTDEE